MDLKGRKLSHDNLDHGVEWARLIYVLSFSTYILVPIDCHAYETNAIDILNRFRE